MRRAQETETPFPEVSHPSGPHRDWSPRKQLNILTAADGGTYHAQADNRQVGVDYITDWITANLP